MTGLLARTCRKCQQREVRLPGERCPHCGEHYGRFELGLDQLMDPGETDAPAWPTRESAITRTIRRAAGLD